MIRSALDNDGQATITLTVTLDKVTLRGHETMEGLALVSPTHRQDSQAR